MKAYVTPQIKIRLLTVADILGTSDAANPEVSVVVDVAGEWN